METFQSFSNYKYELVYLIEEQCTLLFFSDEREEIETFWFSCSRTNEKFFQLFQFREHYLLHLFQLEG